MKATPDEKETAQLVARMIQSQRDLVQRAAGATGAESDWEDFYEWISRGYSNIGFYICNLSGGNPARFLRLVAEILDGKKLRGAPHDDLVLQAIKKANKRSRKTRKAGRGMDISDLLPRPFPEIDAAYLDLTKATPNDRLDERQLRRRVEALGYKRRAQD
jgi:hypothetical protein